MNIDRLRFPILRIPIAIAAGVGLAVAVGTFTGEGNFDRVKMVAYALLVMIYTLFWQQHTWLLGVIICALDMWFVGLGFKMSSLEQSMALGGLLALVTWWRKPHIDKPQCLEHWSYGLFTSLMTAWLIYSLGHLWYSTYDPYNPHDYSLKSASKAALQFVGQFLILRYLISRPAFLRIRENFPYRIAQCLLFGLIANLAMRGYEIATDRFMSTVESPLSDDLPFFQIPLLNLVANVFALRTGTPLTMLIGCTFLFSKWMKDQPPKVKFVFEALVFLSPIGAALSGGRATVLFVMGIGVAIMLMRGRVGFVVAMAAFMIVFTAFVNVFPSALDRMPLGVQRSMQWALVNKAEGGSAGNIEGSTRWRRELAMRALDEWRSDSRIFWFGRATFSFGAADYAAFKIKGDDAAQDIALRRGATHNMITDLLVSYGLIGFILFNALFISSFWFFWRIYAHTPGLHELSRLLALDCFIYGGFNFVYGVFGGGTFPIVLAWFTAVLIGSLYFLKPKTESDPSKSRQRRRSDRPNRPDRPNVPLHRRQTTGTLAS